MSWGTIAVTNVALADLDEALATAAQHYIDGLAANDVTLDSDAVAQVGAAREAAVALATSGQLGEGPFNASLNGHSNVGHAPTPGYSNDFVSISVSSAAKIAEAQPEPPVTVENPGNTPALDGDAQHLAQS